MFRILAAVVLVIASFFIYISMSDPKPSEPYEPRQTPILDRAAERELDEVAAELDALVEEAPAEPEEVPEAVVGDETEAETAEDPATEEETPNR